MRIGMCDDQKIFLKQMRQIIDKYMEFRKIPYTIVEFSGGEELLEYDLQLDILFLDIEMSGIDGLETAKRYQVKYNNGNTKIIFLTSHNELMSKGYIVKAFRFLLKPVEKEALKEAIESAIDEFSNDEVLVLDAKNYHKEIPYKDVIYLEAQNKEVLIRTADGYERITGKMDEYEEKFQNSDFYRTHRSYIVNLFWVKEIVGSEIILKNGERAKIGRDKVKYIKEKFFNYIRKNARG